MLLVAALSAHKAVVATGTSATPNVGAGRLTAVSAVKTSQHLCFTETDKSGVSPYLTLVRFSRCHHWSSARLQSVIVLPLLPWSWRDAKRDAKPLAMGVLPARSRAEARARALRRVGLAALRADRLARRLIDAPDRAGRMAGVESNQAKFCMPLCLLSSISLRRPNGTMSEHDDRKGARLPGRRPVRFEQQPRHWRDALKVRDQIVHQRLHERGVCDDRRRR